MRSTAAAHQLIAVLRSSAAIDDVAIAAIALVASFGLLTHGFVPGHPGSRPGLTGAALVVIATVPLVAARHAPLAVFVVCALASAVAAGVGYALDIPFGPTAALYLLAANRDEVRRWNPLTTAAVAALFVAYVAAAAAAERAFPGLLLLHTGLAWAVAWFAGERTRLLRLQLAELRRRAADAERQGERERRLAAAEERARIARDLHDSAGHAINVIAVRAGAARLRHDQDPGRSLLALQAIEEVARQTAADIDQIVHSLREGGAAAAGPAVPPGLASLPTLVEHHSRAGLDVTVRTSGTPRPLARTADLAAYRILQEALTNAARHGTGAARIELAFDDGTLGLQVTNPVPEGGGRRSEGGHGLVGMRERATLLGGTLQACRAGNRTFVVTARLPYRGRT